MDIGGVDVTGMIAFVGFRLSFFQGVTLSG